MSHQHWCDDCSSAWQHELGECADVRVMNCPPCAGEAKSSGPGEPPDEPLSGAAFQQITVQLVLKIRPVPNRILEWAIHRRLTGVSGVLYSDESASVAVVDRRDA